MQKGKDVEEKDPINSLQLSGNIIPFQAYKAIKLHTYSCSIVNVKNSGVHFSVTVQGCSVTGGDHLEIISSHV